MLLELQEIYIVPTDEDIWHQMKKFDKFVNIFSINSLKISISIFIYATYNPILSSIII